MKVKLALAAASVALSSVAVDLPWVYDLSERMVVDVKSSASANHAMAFVTMSGFWSYESNTSRIRSTPWQGLTIVVF